MTAAAATGAAAAAAVDETRVIPLWRRGSDRVLGESSPSSTTTTISTIAVQSGSTRIVIALLQAGATITIKVFL